MKYADFESFSFSIRSGFLVLEKALSEDTLLRCFGDSAFGIFFSGEGSSLAENMKCPCLLTKSFSCNSRFKAWICWV